MIRYYLNIHFRKMFTLNVFYYGKVFFCCIKYIFNNIFNPECLSKKPCII